MKNFSFENATSIEEAVKLLDAAGEKGYIINGGTDVMVSIRAGLINDKILINIRNIPELKVIEQEEDSVFVGAGCTIAQIGESEIIRKNAVCMAMASQVFADPTIRHSATIGGNAGKASPAGDMLPSLLALDADVVCVSAAGEKVIPAKEFFVGVGKNALEKGDLIKGFRFKNQPNSGFLKLGQRKSMAISIATAAASAEIDKEGMITACRIALGSVKAVPTRAYEAEKAFVGVNVKDKEAMTLAAQTVLADISPITDVRATAEYRKQVAQVLTKRAVTLAATGECM